LLSAQNDPLNKLLKVAVILNHRNKAREREPAIGNFLQIYHEGRKRLGASNFITRTKGRVQVIQMALFLLFLVESEMRGLLSFLFQI